MTEYKIVPSADEGFYTVEGLQQKLLKNMSVTFGCEIGPTDTDQDKADKMAQALTQVRHDNSHAVKDGDVFETSIGKYVVRGNWVFPDDANGTIAANAQQGQNVSTKGMTLAQVCQANGITIPSNFPQTLANTPVDQIPWGTVAVPPHLKPLFAPPAQLPPQQTAPQPGAVPGVGIGKSSGPHPVGPGGPMVVNVGAGGMGQLPPALTNAIQQATGMSLAQLNGGGPVTLQASAHDQNGQTFQTPLQLHSGFTNQDVVDEFDTVIQHAFGAGNLRSVITYPGSTNRRVLEVGYHSDTFRVVIEVV